METSLLRVTRIQNSTMEACKMKSAANDADLERRDLSADEIRRHPQRWDEERGLSPRPSRFLILWR